LSEQVFDELSVGAWRAERSGQRTSDAVDTIFQLAGLAAGSVVADFGCGIGQISQKLAARGVRVYGVDRSAVAIRDAQKDADPLCSFLCLDWRESEFPEKMDCVFFWFTSVCAGKERDFEALRAAHRSLRTGGVLLLETRHWDRMQRQFQTSSRRGNDELTLVENHSYDPVTGFQTTEEYYTTAKGQVQRSYQTRRYTFPELSSLCTDAGFGEIEGFDEHGNRLSNTSERLILRARPTIGCYDVPNTAEA
jgi:SAM-dependent methyltransferase